MKKVKLLEPVLDVRGLCQRLKIGKNTAYKLLQTGELKGFRINRDWKIPIESLDEYIKNKKDGKV